MTAPSTHPSLLSQLRDPANHGAWRTFDRRYGDLILRYAIRSGLQHSDAEDVRQLVLLSLSKALPGFHYSSDRGLFRGYLGQVVRRAVIQFRQAECPRRVVVSLNTVGVMLESGDDAAEDRIWREEWIRHHMRLAMRHIRATFEPQSVEAFDRLLAGESVQDVAKAFEMTEQAVHKIKQRIRNRMRELIARQVRDESLPTS